MDSLPRIMRADWGTTIKSAAYRAAYMVAILIVAAELCYRAGMAAGQAVHWLSDRLGGLASGRIDRAATARAVVSWARTTLDGPPAPAPAPAPTPVLAMACRPVPAEPIAIASPPIDTLTVAQLRKIARARGLSKLARNGKRADLMAALV